MRLEKFPPNGDKEDKRCQELALDLTSESLAASTMQLVLVNLLVTTPGKFTFLVKFRGSDNITSHLRQIWAPSISISHCGLPGLHSHRTMYFLALLLALSQILCCWAIDTQILEVDLVLPQNETYPPSPIFPIIFAVQNPSLAKSFQPMITLQVEQVDGNFSTVDTFKLWESPNDTSSTRFLHWGTSKFDFEGNFRFTWDLSMDRCSLDKETDEVNFGRYSEFQSLYFTAKNGTAPADFVAATDDDTCDKALAQAINYADLSKLPATESTYGPSCLAEPTTLPKPTNHCNAKINSSAAASMSAAMTSIACARDRPGVTCPTPSPSSAASKAHLKMGGAWALATASLLIYCLA